MTRECMYLGIREICDYFGEDYKPEALKLVEKSILPEPTLAMAGAIERAKIELPPKYLPPISKIRDMIIQEGRKIREEEATDREREAARMKEEEKRSRGFNGNTDTPESLAYRGFLRAWYNGASDEELLELAKDARTRFPHSEAFRAWVKKLTPAEPERVRKAAGE